MFLYELFQNNFEILTSEFFITLLILFLLLFCVILVNTKKNSKIILINILNNLIIYFLFFTLILIYNKPIPSSTVLNGVLIQDEFSQFINYILIISTIIFFIFQKNYILQKRIVKFENSILILISVLGLILLSSSYNLITLYLAIELQSLCFYILAASNTKSPLSTEAALKYFILGAIASGFILYGSSIIYFTTGSLNFGNILTFLSNINQPENLELILTLFYGFLFILTGLLFKIGAVPFHIWLPDVYEGSPKNITAFFAIVPKIALIGLIIRLFFDIFNDISDFFESILYITSLTSILIGSLLSLQQKKFKRLFAYSAIGHVGFILIGFVSNTFQDIQNILLYILIYMVMSINIWTIFISSTSKNKSLKYLTDFTNLLKTNPTLAILLMLTLFSMSGLPPLAGFFSKMFIFYSALQQSVNSLAILGILMSVISSFYYIRLIKIAYFDNTTRYIFLNQVSKMNSIIIVLSSHFIIFFFLLIDYILVFLHKVSLTFIL